MIDTDTNVRRHILYKRDTERSVAAVVADRMLAELDAGADPDYMALWRAATWPPPPPIVFHTAPVSARSAIRTTGLRPSQPGTANWRPTKPDCIAAQSDQPIGVYVGARPDTRGKWTHWPIWDIWEVATAGLEWRADELNPGYWSTGAHVRPTRVRLWGTRPTADVAPYVIVPCSAAKADHRGRPAELYTGSFFRHAHAAAEAITDLWRIGVLSAKHGILRPNVSIDPYDCTWQSPDHATPALVAATAQSFRVDPRERMPNSPVLLAPVVLLLPNEYARRVLDVWPDAHWPLRGCRGVGEQRARLSAIRDHRSPYLEADLCP